MRSYLGFCLIVLLVTATQATTDGKIGGPKPPASFDWRTVPQGNTLTPVKDQGPTCNSGWAFAAAAAYEQYVKRLNGTQYDLSEEYLIECSGLSNCTYAPNTLRRIMNLVAANGLPLQAEVPYASVNLSSGKASVPGACSQTNIKVPTKIKAHGSFGKAGAALRADFVKGCSVCSFNATDRFRSYTGGLYSCTSDDAPLDIRETNHAVLGIGYNTDGNFIIKNSYGTGWGEAGYAIIDSSNDCGMHLMCYQLNSLRLIAALTLLFCMIILY